LVHCSLKSWSCIILILIFSSASIVALAIFIFVTGPLGQVYGDMRYRQSFGNDPDGPPALTPLPRRAGLSITNGAVVLISYLMGNIL